MPEQSFFNMCFPRNAHHTLLALRDAGQCFDMMLELRFKQQNHQLKVQTAKRGTK